MSLGRFRLSELSDIHTPEQRAVLKPQILTHFATPFVTVVVGKDPTETFLVHERALKQTSDFFKTALDKKWKEGQSLHIELPEDKVHVFTEYAAWVYSAALDLKLPEKKRMTRQPLEYHEEVHDVEMHLANCYIFGEKILDAQFCNAVIRGFVDNAHAYGTNVFGGLSRMPASVSLDVTNHVYKHTAPGSPIRQLLVDHWISESYEGYDLDDADELHADFSRDILKSLLSMRRTQHWTSGKSAPKAAWYKDE